MDFRCVQSGWRISREPSRRLCETDRRGICTNVTDAGLTLLAQARPTNDAALRAALDEAARNPSRPRSSRRSKI